MITRYGKCNRNTEEMSPAKIDPRKKININDAKMEMRWLVHTHHWKC